MKNYKLIDNTSQSRYEMHVEGVIPSIEYIKSGNGDILLTHTEIPVSIQNHGIGTQLVEKVLEDIEQKDLKVVPLCSFVAGYIRKHPEWNRIVTR